MEEPKTEEKYFHIENVGKNIVTTVVGIFFMIISGGTYMASWFIELPLIHGWDRILGICIVFTVGFALLFMRDKLPTYIDIFTKKKIG